MHVFAKPFAAAATLLVATLATAAETPAPRGPGIRVVVPLSVNANPTPASSARSSANHQIVEQHPEGMWRWHTPRDTRQVIFDLAPRLIVRIERAGPASLSLDDGALARAAEAIPALLEATPDVAEKRFAEAMSTSGETPLQLSAVVERQRIFATCAAIDIWENGAWRSGGRRSTTERVETTEVAVFERLEIASADPAAIHSAFVALVEWVGTHKTSAAAATPPPPDGDVCAAPTTTTPPPAPSVAK